MPRTIPEILSPSEQAFMAQAWPKIRVAAAFSHINWAAVGLPSPPPLSPVSYAAMAYVWPHVRVAADFTHPNWAQVPVPDQIIGASSPLPEVPAAPAPSVPADPVALAPPPLSLGPAISQPSFSDEPLEDTGEPEPTIPAVEQAGMFAGISWPVMIGLTVLGFLLFGRPKLPGRFRARRRR